MTDAEAGRPSGDPHALNPRDFPTYGDYWAAVDQAQAAAAAAADAGTDAAPAGDAVDQLQREAAELVMQANLDPSRLTAPEHERIAALQFKAGRAATEANLLLGLHLPPAA